VEIPVEPGGAAQEKDGSREVIALYWEIGRSILQRQETEGWEARGDRQILGRPHMRIPRHERVLFAQPQICETLCRSLSIDHGHLGNRLLHKTDRF
jgi:hypothetical protein